MHYVEIKRGGCKRGRYQKKFVQISPRRGGGLVFVNSFVHACDEDARLGLGPCRVWVHHTSFIVERIFL